MGLSSELILNLISTIVLYCGQFPDKPRCFEDIWYCGHKVSVASAIVTETGNCIGRHSSGNYVGKQSVLDTGENKE